MREWGVSDRFDEWDTDSVDECDTYSVDEWDADCVENQTSYIRRIKDYATFAAEFSVDMDSRESVASMG